MTIEVNSSSSSSSSQHSPIHLSPPMGILRDTASSVLVLDAKIETLTTSLSNLVATVGNESKKRREVEEALKEHDLYQMRSNVWIQHLTDHQDNLEATIARLQHCCQLFFREQNEEDREKVILKRSKSF